MHRDKQSLQGLKKGTLVYSQAEGQDSLRQTVLYDFNNKSSKEQIKETVPSLGQNWLPPCNSDVIQSWNKIWFRIQEGFPGSSAGKDSACNAGYLGLIPGLGRSPGKGNWYPLQYSGLGNSYSHNLDLCHRRMSHVFGCSYVPKLSLNLFCS